MEKVAKNKFCNETYYFDIKLFEIIMDSLRTQLMAEKHHGLFLELQIQEQKTK